MDKEEFERIWRMLKERDKREEEEWNKLSPKEQEAIRKKYSDGFYERISDDPTGDRDPTSL